MKKLFVAAAVAGLGLVSASSADFFSVNGGGYYKLTIPPGYKIIANQLIRQTNSVADVFQGVPGGTIILKWAGSGFLWNQFDSDFNEWLEPNQTLVPGEGAFIFNPTPTNLTLYMYGELLQGSLTNTVPQGYSLQSAKVPQAGLPEGIMGFFAGGCDVTILRWMNNPEPGPDGYALHTYDVDFNDWDSAPNILVGEGFFVRRLCPGSIAWTRTFTIN
jgi:hypothetical protein